MPRYILIDNASGYIFGDTAAMDRSHRIDGETMAQVGGGGMRPALAARWLDETETREFGRTYTETTRPRDDRTGYHVYRADINGSEAVAVVMDGQDREMIAAVEADCRYICFIECTKAEG